MGLLLILLCLFVAYKSFLYYYQHWVYKKDYSQYKGEYAAVCGASEGIGRALSLELAKKGINLILIARNKEKIQGVAQECEKFNVKTKIIPLDLTKKESFDVLKGEISDVSILINNAGGMVGGKLFEEFMNYDRDDFDYTYNLNFFFVVEVCKIVLPSMKQKKRGIILNCSSLSTRFPYYLSPYTSSKCALNGLGHALNREYGSEGITIQSLLIGMVETSGTKDIEKSFDIVSPEQISQDIINGCGCGGYEFIPNAKQHFFTIILSFIPDYLLHMFIKNHYARMKNKNK